MIARLYQLSILSADGEVDHSIRTAQPPKPMDMDHVVQFDILRSSSRLSVTRCDTDHNT